MYFHELDDALGGVFKAFLALHDTFELLFLRTETFVHQRLWLIGIDDMV